MEVELKDLETLFGLRVRYEMPEYQRDYVWEQFSQWEPLWGDVKATAESYMDPVVASLSENKKHFLGPIIVTRAPQSPNEDTAGMVRSLEVIDGQQRLTTLQLLIHAACECLRPLDTRNATRLQEHIANAEHTWVNNDEDYRFKVWSKSSTTDRETFVHIMSGLAPPDNDNLIAQAHDYFKYEIDAWLAEAREKDEQLANQRNQNIQPQISSSASNRTTDRPLRLSALDQLPAALSGEAPSPNPNILRYCDALRQTLLGLITVVVIESGDDYDANVIYETLNSRGTSLDLWQRVKNLLLTPHRAFESHGVWFTEEDIDPFWDTVDNEVYEDQKHSHTDNLLRHFINFRSQKRGQQVDEAASRNAYAAKDAKGIYTSNAANGIYNEYKRLIERRENTDRQGNRMRNPQDVILRDIAQVANRYKKVEQNAHYNYLFLKRTIPSVFIASLLPLYGERDGDAEAHNALDALASFVARRRLAGKRTTEIEVATLTSEIIYEITPRGGVPRVERFVQFLRKIYNSRPSEWPDDARFAKSIEEYSIYRSSSKVTRAILQALEIQLRIRHNRSIAESEKSLSLILPENVFSIEHIMPQKWSAYWTTSPEEEQEDTRRRNQVVHTLGNLTLVTSDLNKKLDNQQWQRKKELIRSDVQSHQLLMNQLLTGIGTADEWYEEAIWSRARTVVDLALEHWPGPNSPRWNLQD